MLASTTFIAALLAAPTTSLTSDAEAPPPDDWSVGVGAGVSPLLVGGLGSGLGGLGGLGSAVTYGVAIERRLAGDLWLRVRGGIGHTRWGLESAAEQALTALTWSAGLGVRYVLFADGPLSLSGLAMGQASGAGVDVAVPATGVGEPAETLQRTYGVGGGLGLAVEYELVPGLHLRLESQVASLSWSRFESTNVSNGDQASNTSGSSFTARFDLAPALELRMTF